MPRIRIFVAGVAALALLGACDDAKETVGTKTAPVQTSNPASDASTGNAPERNEGAIRVASYNVLNLFDDDDDPTLEGDLDDCHSWDKTVRAKPAEQCAAVAKALRSIDADVIALQEIESYDALVQFRDEHLDGMGYDFIASEDVGYNRGVEQSLLSRFPIKDVKVWPGELLDGEHPELWNGRPNRYAGDPLDWRRSPLCVTVEVPAGAKGNDEAYELTLFVVHHKAGGGNDYWREAEAARLIEIIEEMTASDPEMNVLVLGDFNAQIDELSVRKYLDAGMTDVFAGSDASRDEMRTHESGRRIDFVLANGAVEGEVVDGSAFVHSVPLRPRGADWRTTPTPEGYGSDHLPVVVDLVPVDR